MRVFYTNKFWYALVLFIMLAGIAYVFHNNTLKNYPQYMHTWSQSDHYALVLGFINNDLDLFHPETYNLMPNLEKPTEFETSITAVDFPLVEFISATVMKAFNLRSPLTYRLINIICSVIALIFIYLISWRMKIPSLAGLLLSLILACSPIYIYYQAAILPSVPAFMLASGAVYFYLLYLEKINITFLLIAILFITTATGIRKPFLIFFTAIFIHHLYLSFRKQKEYKSLLVWLIGAGLLIAHQLYQSYLYSKYGSAFLGSIMPTTSLDNFIHLSKIIFNNWNYHIYSKGLSYLLIGVATWFFLRLYYDRLNRLQENFSELLIIFTGAAFVYFIAMQEQFISHDYYFIDIFYLPFALLFILFISHIHLEIQWKENIFVFILAFVFFWSISDARVMHKSRTQVFDIDYMETERKNFEGSEHFLDSIGIEKDARILCLNANTTNTPLILMNRKGYTIHKNRKEYIESAIQWPYEHIVMQNQYTLSHTFAEYPELFSQVKRIHSNGKISVFEKTAMDSSNISTAFGIEKIKTLVTDLPDSSYMIPNNWFVRLQKDSSFFNSEPYSSLIPENKLYPFTLEMNKDEIVTNNSFVEIIWKSKVYFNDISKKVNLVVSKEINDSTSITMHYDLTDLADKNNEWKEIQVLCPITDLDKMKSVKIYIWNPNKNKFWIDDTEAAVYQTAFK